MLKLSRLNRSVVAINPDHIIWAEQSPDTTLCLLGGDRLIVRESIDEIIDKLIEFRLRTGMENASLGAIGAFAASRRASRQSITNEADAPPPSSAFGKEK